MACLANPLDIAFASDAEVFDDTKLVEIYSRINWKNKIYFKDIDEVMIRNMQHHLLIIIYGQH